MKSEIKWARLFVAVFTVCGLLLAGMPGTAYAQGNGNGPKEHKWKHDKIHVPGPPCPKADRPCPPGLPGGTNPGGNTPPGQNRDLAINGLFVAGMEPTPAFVTAVTGLRESTFPMATPVPAPAQTAVFDVFGSDEDAGSTALARGLTSRGNDGAMEASTALIVAMRSLTTQDGQLPATVDAFNSFVDASSDTFLADPSPEFLVLHSFIGALVEEAMGTPEGSR